MIKMIKKYYLPVSNIQINFFLINLFKGYLILVGLILNLFVMTYSYFEYNFFRTILMKKCLNIWNTREIALKLVILAFPLPFLSSINNNKNNIKLGKNVNISIIEICLFSK